MLHAALGTPKHTKTNMILHTLAKRVAKRRVKSQGGQYKLSWLYICIYVHTCADGGLVPLRRREELHAVARAARPVCMYVYIYIYIYI